MKRWYYLFYCVRRFVAPFAGAWIETGTSPSDPEIYRVAPFAGAWIETRVLVDSMSNVMSLLSQERGLKQTAGNTAFSPRIVAPFAGAWIETTNVSDKEAWRNRRSFRRSVD